MISLLHERGRVQDIAVVQVESQPWRKVPDFVPHSNLPHSRMVSLSMWVGNPGYHKACTWYLKKFSPQIYFPRLQITVKANACIHNSR